MLFADVKGSMELLADRDPEEARKLVDPVLERMMEAVHRYEGTVNQVMGDGIMALFGAPLAHEDHAVRACYAALQMQEALKRYADDARRSYGVEVQIRVGLNYTFRSSVAYCWVRHPTLARLLLLPRHPCTSRRRGDAAPRSIPLGVRLPFPFSCPSQQCRQDHVQDDRRPP